MGRKPVIRSLPELKDLNPHFAGFPPESNQAAELLQRLRRNCRDLRQRQDAPFYSMREVARFFRVDLRTVARAYNTLEQETLLTIRRGSHTLLRGTIRQPMHSIRGVVGVAINLPAFVHGTELRSFYVRLEEELRRKHFVVDFIFYRLEDEGSPELAERLMVHELDFVLWMNPSGVAISTIQRLLDGGVHVVLMGDGRARYPVEQYFLDKAPSLHQALAAWRTAGISRVRLVTPARAGALVRAELPLTTRVLRNQDLPWDEVQLEDGEVPRFLGEDPANPATGFFFAEHAWYLSLCNQYPEQMADFFSCHRVLLLQGPVHHPTLRRRKIVIDAISLDSSLMARTIARDISAGKTASLARLATFNSLWLQRLNLAEVPIEI